MRSSVSLPENRQARHRPTTTDPAASERTQAPLAARGESPASHRDERGASRTRRDDREYGLYLKEEQRRPRGCVARRMQTDFHHGLLGQARQRRPLGR